MHDMPWLGLGLGLGLDDMHGDMYGESMALVYLRPAHLPRLGASSSAAPHAPTTRPPPRAPEGE